MRNARQPSPLTHLRWLNDEPPRGHRLFFTSQSGQSQYGHSNRVTTFAPQHGSEGVLQDTVGEAS